MAFDLKSFTSTVRVSDGAWGTQLQARGLPVGSPPELWNVENPAAVSEVASGYVAAGSDVILANTFGANRLVMAPYGAADRITELAEAGAAISRQAAGDKVKVFGSIGPSGVIVMMGDVPADELVASFAETAQAAINGGVDAFVLETFNEIDELALAIKGVRSVSDLPIVASMTFDSGPDQTATMMGAAPKDLAAVAAEHGADAVGANCGLGPDKLLTVVGLLREATDLPIWSKANAGLPVVADGETTFPMGSTEFATFVPALVDAGANFIGGCCGTTPEHIKAVRSAVNSLG
jgi:5-methyltetrahydrofolate--homocysteine methyltransferase